VQIKLWKAIQNLRRGIYYEDSPIGDFISALNACRNNLYDNADLAYNQDEGAMLRRLMSVFSLRPIMVRTSPYPIMSGFYGMGGMGMGMGQAGMGMGIGLGNQQMTPFMNQALITITTIPMITVHIPNMKTSATDVPITLQGSINQCLWLNENKALVPKLAEIIHAKELLIFYANRRIPNIQIRTFVNPLPFSQLPLTLNSFSRINACRI